MKLFHIRVWQEGGGPILDEHLYRIEAHTEIDARVIAFCLDGGHHGNIVDRGVIELTKAWTTVL